MTSRLEPGAWVGDMRIVRAIGAGAVAAVYEVERRGERCALKILHGPSEGTTVGERLRQEAEALATVEHPNVVRWLDGGMHEGRPWILLELVDGPNLREVLRAAAGGRLGVERAVRLARQACEGLAALHRKGIAHRDVKPENMLVGRGGAGGAWGAGGAGDVWAEVVKIGDLGSGRMKWGVKTTDAQRIGSLRYAPPERWLGAGGGGGAGGAVGSGAGDVYAMGNVVFEMVAGVHPIAPEGTDVLSLCRLHLEHVAVPLGSVARVGEVPGDLAALVAWALEKDPARRCTMQEMAERLEVVQDRLLAWRRAAARRMGEGPRELGLAATVPVRVVGAEVGAVEKAREAGGGTIRMEVVQGEVGEAVGGGDRAAVLPVGPVGAEVAAEVVPSGVPPTLRVMSRPGPVLGEGQGREEVRRSTGIPVVSAARVSGAGRGRRGIGIAVGVGVIAVLGVAAWWVMAGGVGAAPEGPVARPVVAGPAAGGAGSAVPPVPSVSASAMRPPARPRGVPAGRGR